MKTKLSLKLSIAAFLLQSVFIVPAHALSTASCPNSSTPLDSSVKAPAAFQSTIGNLSNFRLILPVNSYDCGFYNYLPQSTSSTTSSCPNDPTKWASCIISATTINPTILSNVNNNYYYPNYFYVDSDNTLILRAPANGATTTPGVGSDHPRTEMVEYYRDPTGGGDGNGNWLYSTGGILEGDVKIDSVTSVVTTAPSSAGEPTTSGGAAVFAQLHAAGSPPFVVVFYTASTDSITMYVYNTTSSSDGFQKAVISGIGGTDGSALHKFFHYQLRFGQNDGGNVVLTVSPSTYSPSIAIAPTTQKLSFNQNVWSQTYVRFSLGAYQNTTNQNITQLTTPLQTDQATNYTQVGYKYFNITHPFH